jgi:hypothetical protein
LTLQTAIPNSAYPFVRVVVWVVWILLFGLLLRRDYFVDTLSQREAKVVQEHARESFLGVYFKGERIGYVKHVLTQGEGDELVLAQEAYLLLHILNEHHPVRMQARARLTRGSLLKGFEIHFDSPFYRMDASGEVEGNVVRFVINTGKDRISDSLRLASPPLLTTNRRAYLLDAGLKVGDKIKVPSFDPLSLAGQDAVVQYKGREKQIIQGRVYNLHRFVESYGSVRVNSWLNDEGLVVKEESPAGFVFIAEPEFRATEISDQGAELLSTVAVPLTGQMPDLADRQTMRFRLQLPPEGAFPALGSDRQSLLGDILTVTRETLPTRGGEVCPDQSAELAATPYIQVAAPAITTVAHEQTSRADTPLAKVRALTAWVYANLEKRPVLGIPDAVTTLESRKGDCNEHAALFAALARACGIPTRVVAGVTFHAGAFYYHAWNEVCLDRRWLSLDTTSNQFPADLTHIKFVQGGLEEQMKIGALLGKLSIAIAEE